MKLSTFKRTLFLILFSVTVFGQIIGQSKIEYLTKDGTWCWFSDPRAIMVGDDIITGWVKSNGTIEAAKLNTAENKVETSELYYLLEADDHDNPAFTTTASGEVIVMYTRHSRKDLFINYLTAPKGDFDFSGAQMIHPLSDQELEKFPRATMTYANPFRLENENNRIYCFGRWTGFKPNMMWSDDNGKTWTKSRVFITNYPFDHNNRPYVKYFSDGKSKIHIVFTDGHPRDEPTNCVYYVYYENGAFYKANGEQICTMEQLPFEPEDASVVYTSNPEQGRAWIADIGQDNENNPVILYTRSPKETSHEYWYARYTEKGWIDNKICDSGKWFPQTPEEKKEPEPHYFGGMSIHPGNANVVYLSRQINGVFEIERRETENKGKSWETEAITENSEYDNVRPYIPRGISADSKEIVLWMENQKYIHYTNFKTSIKYLIRD
ncbi:MAG: BNR-4 repeat-containing protein [Bacteroidales bacterium]